MKLHAPAENLPCQAPRPDDGPRSLLGCVIDVRDIADLASLHRQFGSAPRGQLPICWSTPRRPLGTGVRAIDGLVTLALGQRIALVADAGACPAAMLLWIARHNSVQTNVLVLGGYKSREVRDFVQGLGPEGLRRSVIIVAPADQPGSCLADATGLARTIAQSLCDAGGDVLLAVDLMAAASEAPSEARRLPEELLGVAGDREIGSITAVCLTEDAPGVGGWHDGNWAGFDAVIRLRRDRAERGYFPPIDVLASFSRAHESPPAAALVLGLLADYEAIEEALNTAAYRPGNSFRGDLALRTRQAVLRYLQQSPADATDLATAQAQLMALQSEIEGIAADRAGVRFHSGSPRPLRLSEVEPPRALAG